ncbi:MAG: hypothetical protein JWL82_17 [Parcubacteria group bacterium]|nr:hypothetical protein [Parcubacteria group bacterium]
MTQADIATLETASNSLDSIAKLIRLLADGGVSSQDLHLPVSDTGARRRLIEFLRVNCDSRRKMLKPGDTIRVPALLGKRTNHYFKEGYAWRGDENAIQTHVYPQLAKKQQDTQETRLSLSQPIKSLTLSEMAACLLDVPLDTDCENLSHWLMARKLVTSLGQIEYLVESDKKSAPVFKVLEKRGTCFFVANRSGGVSVLALSEISPDIWAPDVRPLDHRPGIKCFHPHERLGFPTEWT